LQAAQRRPHSQIDGDCIFDGRGNPPGETRVRHDANRISKAGNDDRLSGFDHDQAGRRDSRPNDQGRDQQAPKAAPYRHFVRG
jgi:hypothetical protein